jgi:hypothetical protein
MGEQILSYCERMRLPVFYVGVCGTAAATGIRLVPKFRVQRLLVTQSSPGPPYAGQVRRPILILPTYVTVPQDRVWEEFLKVFPRIW